MRMKRSNWKIECSLMISKRSLLFIQHEIDIINYHHICHLATFYSVSYQVPTAQSLHCAIFSLGNPMCAMNWLLHQYKSRLGDLTLPTAWILKLQ